MPGDTERIFERGVDYHQQGQLTLAKAAYEEVLMAQPAHSNALHLLGVIAAQSNQPALAVQLIGRAIAANPAFAEAYSSLATALMELNQAEQGLLAFEQAIALKPDYAEVHYNRGLALQKLEQLESALCSYEQAISLKPDYADAWLNRGLALEKLQRPEDALASFQQALALNPGNAEAFFNCANALHKLLRLEDALRLYDQAIALQADYAAAYSNRGTVLLEQNRLEEALSSYDTAIALNRENAETWFNRGCAIQQLDQAISSYDQAIALKPDYAEAYFNKALASLLGGQFRQGWKLYEWRMQCEKLHTKRSFPQVRWTGAENLDGKTILLHGEQGLGDSIQFCRYTRLVQQTGAKVLLEVPRPLIELLKTLDGVDEVIEQGQPLPVFDCHCPLMSLPLAFGTELHTIPSPGPYLQSSADKRRQWQQRLGAKTRPRVGLVWRGNTAHKGDRARSLPLVELLPYLPPQLAYVSLQKDVREADQQPLQHSAIRHYGEHLADFSDTAALCDLLDLVVSVDTSVAHLAAALGKPTWILLPHAPDWRWLLDRSDSPWYPTARLYRQTRPADWGPVLERLTMDLAAV